jgi:hypothetical protein
MESSKGFNIHPVIGISAGPDIDRGRYSLVTSLTARCNKKMRVTVTTVGSPAKKQFFMNTEIKNAVELYDKACFAEEIGQLDLAESYYLKSAYAFEQVGSTHMLNTANAFNALAFLRASRVSQAGALCAAKKSAQIMENYRAGSASHKADLIQGMAWELINDLINTELRWRSLIPSAAQ